MNASRLLDQSFPSLGLGQKQLQGRHRLCHDDFAFLMMKPATDDHPLVLNGCPIKPFPLPKIFCDFSTQVTLFESFYVDLDVLVKWRTGFSDGVSFVKPGGFTAVFLGLGDSLE